MTAPAIAHASRGVEDFCCGAGEKREGAGGNGVEKLIGGF
jgi:hypothetical protein